MAHSVSHFESKLQKVLDRVRLILNAERAPCFATEVHHEYQDKYLLAECATRTAAASQLNCLVALGLSPEGVAQLRAWAHGGTAVSLRFRAEERCTFIREATRDVESPRKQVSELSVGGRVMSALTSKVVTTVTEYFWKMEASYELTAFRGVGEQAADRILLQSRQGMETLVTNTKFPPRPEARVPAALHDINVSWLFRELREGNVPGFAIDRSSAKCHTPRRNPAVEAAIEHFAAFNNWCAQVGSYLQLLLNVQPDPTRRLDLSPVSSDSVFVPVIPMLRAGAATIQAADPGLATAAPEGGGILCCLEPPALQGLLPSVHDTNSLLAEECRQLSEKRTNLLQSFPVGDTVATAAEAILVSTLLHCSGVCAQWLEAVDYIEGMLRKQLIDAIGKEVTPADFAEYMRFHNRKLFSQAFAPVPFCFSVRRADENSPEGSVSIEEEVTGGGGDSNIAAPIVTVVARSARPHPMQFALSASSTVTFGGERYLHAWLSHRFSGQSGQKLTLVARARQFSSFIVLVGRISSQTTFDPKYAAIVQNKDELSIPLDLSTIPTPKEFKDAIESLSTEQQAFAKAFRSMQLESTLFGVLVIQIKPQLEKVLNLPEDSLTKEIKLTQDLMQLFITYQIPSDLLSFDPDTPADGMEVVEATPQEKLEAVKAHVKAMQEMIAQAKAEEIQERVQEAQYAHPLHKLQEAQRMADLEDLTPKREVRTRHHNVHRSRAAPASASVRLVPPPASASPVPVRAPASPSAASQASPGGGGGSPTHAAAATPTPSQGPPQPAAGAAAAAAGPLLDGVRDYTEVPRELDARFEKLDTDSALRPTIITPGAVWSKKAQKALLASPKTSALHSAEQKTEKDSAFDLLDALTKSGGLPVDHASLHIVIAATHCFDKTVTETVVQDNVNPIDKVERSTLIMASTIHDLPTAALIRDTHLARVQGVSPMLFLEDENQ